MNFLASCQITQIKFSPKKHTFLISCVWLHQNLENSVGPTWVNIVPSLSGDSVLLSSPQQMETVGGTVDHILALSFYKDASIFVFSDIQCSRIVLVLKQIEQLFIVNLKETAVYCLSLAL